MASQFKARGPRYLGGLLLAAGGLFAVLLFGNILRVALGPEPLGPGDPAPEFSLPTPDGAGRVFFTGDRAQVTLLDFWFMDCPGCVGATPKLNRLHDRYRAEGLALISLSRDAGEEARLRAFIAERDIRYQVGVDTGAVGDSYGVHAFPTVLLVDRKGHIRARHTGAVTELKLATSIEALLAER